MSDIIIGRKRKDIRKQLRGNTFGGNIMKRKNIKNDKVLRAITIGLATMIAATSAPVNVYAGEDDTTPSEPVNVYAGEDDTTPSEPVVEETGTSGSPEEPSGEPETSSEEPAADFTVTDTNLAGEDGGIEIAKDLQTVSVDPATNEPIVGIDPDTGKAIGSGLLPDAIDAAVAAGQTVNADDGITTASEDLITAAGAVVKTEQALENVEDALENLKQGDATNPVAPIEYVGETQSDEKSSTEVKVLPSTKDEDGNEHLKTKTETDEDGNVSETPDVFDNDGNIVLQAPTDGGLLVKSFYDDYSKAIGLAQKGDAESLKQAKEIAVDASEKLEQEKIKVENLKEAIKDSAAAQKAVAAAKDKLQRIEDIRTKYEAFMNAYYKKMNGSGYKADDFDNQAELVALKDDPAKDTQDKNYYDASNAGKDSFDLGNELTKQIVELAILEEGGSNIDWVGDKVKPGGDNGRYNYLTVGYTDKDGKKAYKYVNDIFKDSFYGEQESDRTSGVIYISERFDEKEDGIDANKNGKPDTKWQDYDPSSTKYYDNYKRIPTADALKKAKDAVEAAENKAEELQAKVNALAKAATGVDEPALIEKELEKAEKALENSEQKLNVLRELLGFLSERQEKEATVTPGPTNENPSEDNITDDDDTTDDDDDTTGGDETPGAGGGVVFDPSTGTFSAPAYGFGSTVLPGFTGGPATGVLGVRTDGGTEADEGGVADSRTNVAPRANFSTVNKVLGSRQNKDNSQLAKKIKDNEIPLAEIPNMDDEVTMNWMWLLIIFLLGATGKKMYDEYKKKKEAEEAAKINK